MHVLYKVRELLLDGSRWPLSDCIEVIIKFIKNESDIYVANRRTIAKALTWRVMETL